MTLQAQFEQFMKEKDSVLVGQVYKDNDPRSEGRNGIVVEIDQAFHRARLNWGARNTWVSLKRLRPIGRLKGYTLVTNVPDMDLVSETCDSTWSDSREFEKRGKAVYE